MKEIVLAKRMLTQRANEDEEWDEIETIAT